MPFLELIKKTVDALIFQKIEGYTLDDSLPSDLIDDEIFLHPY